MSTDIESSLQKKYGEKIKIYPPVVGTCKLVYVIEQDKNKFAVLIDRKKSVTHQYRFLRSNYLQKFLFEQGLNVADVREIFEIYKGRVAACHEFIDGINIDTLNENTAYEVGKIIAEFHLKTKSGYIPHFRGKYRFLQYADKLKSSLRIVSQLLQDPDFKGLPRGICHYDLNLTNFMLLNNQVYLIDFDRWRRWPYAYEIWRFIQNLDFANIVLAGYQSVRSLEDAEKSYLNRKMPSLNL